MRTSGVVDRGGDPAGRPAPSWGADDALTQLYAAHWAGLVRLAWLLTHDAGRAPEIVQDVVVASHDRLAALRAEGTALAYLRRGVVNAAMSVHRHRRVEDRFLHTVRETPDVPGRLVAESAETEVLRHTDEEDLLATLRHLPDRQRAVLVLRYWSDLSEQQIADTLEISTGAVKTHAHRGLAALRDALGGTR